MGVGAGDDVIRRCTTPNNHGGGSYGDSLTFSVIGLLRFPSIGIADRILQGKNDLRIRIQEYDLRKHVHATPSDETCDKHAGAGRRDAQDIREIKGQFFFNPLSAGVNCPQKQQRFRFREMERRLAAEILDSIC